MTAKLTTNAFTGWDRARHEQFCESVLAGFVKHMDHKTGEFRMPEHLLNSPAWSRVGNDQRPGATTRDYFLVEAWERIMVGVACYLAGTGRNAMPGVTDDLAKSFRRRLVRGCDPNDPLFFGDHPGLEQTGCYAPLALLIAPQWLLDPMEEQERERVLNWLATALPRPSHDNNHYLFHLQCVPLLDRYNHHYDREFADELLERVMGFYSGGGWFQDGTTNSYDYYNAWGFQYYLLILTHFHRPWRERYGEEIASISRKYFEDFPWLFAESGAHVAYGRTLLHRFGVVDPLPWAFLAAETMQAGNDSAEHFWPHPPGLARRLMSGNFKYFADNDCLDAEGFLDSGFLGTNHAMLAPYSSPASSSWAVTSFAHLLLPESHPFWTDPEPALPAGAHPMAGPQWLTRRTPDGNVKLYPMRAPRPDWPGWQIPLRYYGLVYDSDIGMAVDPEGKSLAGRFCVSFDHGQTWLDRSEPLSHSLNRERGRSVFPTNQGRIATDIVTLPEGEIFIFTNLSGKHWKLRLATSALQIPDSVQESANAELPEAENLPTGILRTSSMSACLHLYASVAQTESPRAATWESVTLHPRPGLDQAHLFGGSSAWLEIETADLPPKQVVIVWHCALANPNAEFNPPEVVVDNPDADHTELLSLRINQKPLLFRQ